MKNLGMIVVKAMATIGILLATIIGVIIGGIIDFSYELICIIRYWFVRGVYEIMVRLNADKCQVKMWNDGLGDAAIEDSRKITKLFKLRIDD